MIFSLQWMAVAICNILILQNVNFEIRIKKLIQRENKFLITNKSVLRCLPNASFIGLFQKSNGSHHYLTVYSINTIIP